MPGPSKGSPLTDDYREMLSALSAENVEYIVVGAYAVAFHGSPRATGDLDILVSPTPENAQRVYQGLLRFGAPLSGVTINDFASPGLIFRIGRAPNCIDITTDIDGVDFPTAWKNHVKIMIEDQAIPVLGIHELLASKIAAGRPKDLFDIAWIKQHLADEAT